MSETTMQFIIDLLEQKGPVPEAVAVEDYEYLESGHIDSMGLLTFILVIEEKYHIEFSEAEIASPYFRTIFGLSDLIDRKVKK